MPITRKFFAVAAAALALGGAGAVATVAISDSDAPTLCSGAQVTYTQNGSTQVGDCWLNKSGSLQVAGSDGVVRQIPRSAVVTATTPPPTTTTTTTDPPPPPAAGQIYSSDSPFNQLVGTPTVATNSTTLVNSALSGNVPTAISTDRAESVNYDHPVYYPKSTDPLATLKLPGSGTTGTYRIPVPNYAIPAGASDHHIAFVYDGWEYNLWNATKSGTAGNYTFTAAIGGRMLADGPGIKTPSLVAQYSNYEGGVEAKFGERAGIITAAEMQAGNIPHALFVVVSAAAAGTSGGTYPGYNTPYQPNDKVRMGTRFRLNMTDAQIAASGAPAWEQTIARAAAKYGIYVGDKGGGGFGFMLESSTPYNAAGATNPWDSYWPSQGLKNTGTYGYNAVFSGKINWKANLQVIAPPPPHIP